MFPSILIVDDEPSILQSLEGILTDEGFEVVTASNGYEALKRIEVEAPELVLLDIWMPGLDGIETLKEIKKTNPHIQVIIITGHGNIETAVKATKIGAFDLIEKPLSIDKIIVAINNALNFRRLEEENRYLRSKTLEKHSITGNSPQINELKKQISLAAPSDNWIFITGENGTGKELVARTIHQLSPRVDAPLIDVNCAAISDSLMDDELFGREKDMEGKSGKKIGKLELVDTGTLFFDEIGDMSLKLQSKLLRVFQEQKFERVGGTRTLDMKARIIASTNKDMKSEIAKGKFREDLFYRLNVIPVHVPPLRDRAQDIPLLIESFLKEALKTNRQKPKVFSPDAVDLMCRYDWPGNVRELKNTVERLLLMVEKDVIDEHDVSSLFGKEQGKETNMESLQLFSMKNLKSAKKAFEKEYIQRKMNQFNRDIKKTADAIGIKTEYLKKNL